MANPKYEETKKLMREIKLKYFKEHPEKRVEIGNKIKQLYNDHPEISIKQKETLMISYIEHPEWRDNARARRMKQHFPSKNTSIELKLKNFLEKLNIKFEMHKSILGRTQPDFFIEPNICIYADGNYWHNYPYGTENDKILTELLLVNKFRVLRLWEHEINKMNIDIFKNKLNEVIKNG